MPRWSNGHQPSNQAGFLQGLEERARERLARSRKTRIETEVPGKEMGRPRVGRKTLVPGIVLGPEN